MDNFYKNLLKSCLDTPKSGNTTSWDTVLGMKAGSSFEQNFLHLRSEIGLILVENQAKLNIKHCNCS